MRYILLNACFVLIILFFINSYTHIRASKAMLYTLGVLVILTAIFDSLIIHFGVVDYNADNILGLYIIKAPIEDFAYTIASVIIVCKLWDYYDSK